MWGIGIIGAGSYGAQHAEAIAALDNARVVASSRTNAAALAEFTAQYGGTGYTDNAALLADPAVDAVVIATPHHLHTQVALDAAAAGKHILLEKPMAPTRDECRQIIAATRQAGVKLMIGHVNHFAPAYAAAKQLIDSGEMGEIIHGLATMQKFWFESNRREWHLDRSTGGGVWMTVGIHPLDRLTWLVDHPVVTVSAQFSTRYHDQAADDVGMAFLRYANGAAGTIVSTGYTQGAPKHLTELTCTKGMVNVDYAAGVSIGRDDQWRTLPETVPQGNWMHEALVGEWRGFLSAIEADTETPVSGEFAAHIMDVIFSAEESSQQRRELAVNSTWKA